MFQSLKNLYHYLRARLANIWYQNPSKYIKVIGVTGTDGKTTTTHLIYHILRKANRKVSMISTVYAKIGEQEFDTGFHVTTPDAFIIPQYIRKAVDEKQEYFVLETTSHRLEQNQLAGIQFELSVLTNITHEHLDYHESIQKYAQSKFKLLTMSKKGIVNTDDKVTVQELGQRIKEYKTFGLIAEATYKKDVRKDFSNLPLFNAYNYLAAYSVCKEIGLNDEQIIQAMQSFQLPQGRMEVVYSKDYTVIVDFAHTPNALSQALNAVRRQYLNTGGKLIHVFGAAGLRDKTKREAMGETSAQYADITILTEEDCRTENPLDICEAIARGLKNHNKKYEIYVPREKAIYSALDRAKTNDVVIITGKGHEKSLCRGTVEYPWSDIECVQKYLKQKKI